MYLFIYYSNPYFFFFFNLLLLLLLLFCCLRFYILHIGKKIIEKDDYGKKISMMKVAGGVNRMIIGRRLRRLGFDKWKEMVQRVCGQEVWLCSRKKKKKRRMWSEKRDAPLREIWEQLHQSWRERRTIEGAAVGSLWGVRVHVWERYRREEKKWG